jgi:hypothetical protein
MPSLFLFFIHVSSLFGEEVHHDLLRLVETLLNDTGEALFFAPTRGQSLSAFYRLASSHTNFLVSLERDYDEDISRFFQTKSSEVDYDEDKHRTLLLTIRKRAVC